MTLAKEQSVTRTAPNGDKQEFIISTDTQLQYHEDLQANGFTYELVESDWLEAAKPQVRIHRAPTGCLACEG